MELHLLHCNGKFYIKLSSPKNMGLGLSEVGLSDIARDFGFEAANVYLVAEGKKPIACIPFANWLSNGYEYEYLETKLAQLGLSSQRMGLEKNDRIIVARYGNKKTIRDLEKSFERGDHRLTAELLGFPECCTNAYLDPSFDSNSRYKRQMQNSIKEKGNVSGLEHLPGIRHIPCNLSCQATIDLGYAQHLRDTAPILYLSEFKRMTILLD